MADALQHLADSLHAAELYSEAIEASNESIRIRRELVSRHGIGFLPALSNSLNNSVKSLIKIERAEAALANAKEAVAHNRELRETVDSAFEVDLARSCGTLGTALKSLERHSATAEAFGEGLRIILPLVDNSTDGVARLALGLTKEYFSSLKESGERCDDTLATEINRVLAPLVFREGDPIS